MSSRVYLLGIAMVLVALAFVITDGVLGSGPGVTEANVRRIRVGMTLQEVEAILGGPGKGPVPGPNGWGTGFQRFEFDSIYYWTGRGGTAVVYISIRGSTPTVYCAGFSRTEQPSPLARLRDWLGW